MDEVEYRNDYDWALCKVCHTRFIDRTSGNPREFMCKECRAELKKLKVPKWLIASMCVVGALAIAMIIYTVGLYSKNAIGRAGKAEGNNIVKEAEKLYEDGRQFTALRTLDEYLAEYPGNAELAIKATDMAMESGQYDFAAYFLNTYLWDKAFTDAEWLKIQQYIDRLNRYYDTVEKIDTVFTELTEEYRENMSDEEVEELRAVYRSKLLKVAEDEKYDAECVYFYYGNFLAASVDEGEKYLSESVNYLPSAAFTAARLAVNERRKGDFSAAERWISLGEQTNGEAIELVRAKATLALAKGEYNKALSLTEEIYGTAPDETYVRDTYGIALYANGETDKLNEVISEAESLGYVFDEDFFDVINGRKSVFDYYVGEED